MCLEAQSFSIMLLTWVLYLGAGIALMTRWKPFRAGLAMVAAASLPLFWQVIFTDSDAPGFAFLLAVMLVPAAAVLLLGVVAAICRLLWPGGEWA